MNIEQIRHHIDTLIKQKGKNYRSLSMAIGKNEAYLHQYINKGSPLRLPEEQRRKLALLLDVDEQQLTDIKLPKSIETSNISSNNVIVEMIATDRSLEDAETTGFWSIPLSQILTVSQSKPEDLKLLRVSGDSMQPTFKDGDYVFADLSTDKFCGDGLYLIEQNNHLLVRRVQQFSSNEALLISDNANYKTVTSSFKKLKIVGKIVYALHTQKIS